MIALPGMCIKCGRPTEVVCMDDNDNLCTDHAIALAEAKFPATRVSAIQPSTTILTQRPCRECGKPVAGNFPLCLRCERSELRETQAEQGG